MLQTIIFSSKHKTTVSSTVLPQLEVQVSSKVPWSASLTLILGAVEETFHWTWLRSRMIGQTLNRLRAWHSMREPRRL